MSFIHSILFGFPTKQVTELRYEPKKMAKYGGKLVVLFPKGKAVIERVKGKAAGDLNVMMEDGKHGKEELLKELLSGIDKSLFQSIFSFNLHGLQNIQQMKGEDLGKFLFSTGALGTDRLLLAENTLQKNLETRFKPSGKKPLINEKINQVKQLHQELKKAEQHNEQYWKYIEEKASLEEQLTFLQNELLQFHGKQAKLQEWKRMLPLINEENALKDELSNIGGVGFPHEGLSLLEKIDEQMTPCEGKLKSLIEKIEKLQLDIDEKKPNVDLLGHEFEITTAVENFPLYEQLKQESNQLSRAIEELKTEMTILQQKLHIPFNETQLLNSNTSVFIKEKSTVAQAKQLRLKEKKRELDEQFHQEKQELDHVEEKLSQLRESLLPEAKRLDLINQNKLSENRNYVEREWSELQDQKRFLSSSLQNETKREKNQKQQGQIQLIVFTGIFLFIAGWGLFSQQWGIFGIAIAALIYLLGFHRNKFDSKVKELELELDRLTEKEQELLKILQNSKMNNRSDIEKELEHDTKLREQYNIFQIKWEQKNHQYERILQAYENWEQESHLLEKQLLELGEELNIPRDISLLFIHDAYLLIDKLKSVYIEKQQLESRAKMVHIELDSIEKKIKDLADKFFISEASQLQNRAYVLRQTLRHQLELQILYHEKTNKMHDLQEEQQQLQKDMNRLQLEKKELFALASVDTNEQFREKGVLAARQTKLTERVNEIQRQLEFSQVTTEVRKEFGDISDPEGQMNIILFKQKECQQQVVTIQEQLAELKHQIALLEDGGTYAELLHRFKQAESELNEDAKDWARYAVAKDLLGKAVEEYKNKRLPALIEKAESYLSFLTDGNYQRIYSQKEGSSFLIESNDSTLFEPNELSQATSEQIYVALRFALATTLYDKYQFPIIIDDSFVNFDHLRTKKVIELLRSLKGHQILFFTCHQHFLDYFNHDQVITLEQQSSNPV